MLHIAYHTVPARLPWCRVATNCAEAIFIAAHCACLPEWEGREGSVSRCGLLGAWKGNSDNVEPSDSSGDVKLYSID